MKIALWIALCGLCAAVGHVLLGAVAAALLLGCLPARGDSGTVARQEDPLTRKRNTTDGAGTWPRQETSAR
ncbi:hypothetical protein GCM10009754_50580 [Amycolatopsis minnesotensis]|uniref:Lipoprotein n=1 Tax=Amycolatopsis minnesotensis TaxID=337894 RepID=A0ABN2RKX1_9PSEU